MSAQRPDMEAKKANPALLWGSIGGAVALGLVLFFVFKGKAKPEDTGPVTPPAPTYDAQKKIADLSRAFPTTDGAGAWALATALDLEAAAWEMKKAPAEMVASLRAEAAKAMEPFDEAYAKTDWSRFEHLPLFRAANRMNAYNTYLLMEQQGEP